MMRIICIEDKEQRPQRAEEGQRPPALTCNHSIELDNPEDGSDSYYNGKPGVAEPDGNEEDGYEDYCA